MKLSLPLRHCIYPVIAAAVAVGLCAPVAGAAPRQTTGCTEVSVPVALDPGGPDTSHIAGSYCVPDGGPGTTLQILIPGATYDRSYWDFPGFDSRYSYVGHALESGKATLAIDPIGVGNSSKPPGAQVSAYTAAQTVHEVIAAARDGQLGHRWEKIVLVGHSFGSLTAMMEAGTYHDVDGLLISGASHAPGPAGILQIQGTVRPALLDPLTKDSVPAGDYTYLSVPDARAKAFHAPGDSDPGVVAADEASRVAGTIGVLATIPVFIPTTFDIDVPVLIANGRADKVFCAQGGGGSLTDCTDADSLYRSEQPFFPQADLSTYVLPGAGHSMNLALNNREFFDRATSWVDGI
ncbi:pimeloyl-ACP methyl ester carboxylesterase [Williamsia muralis]|uniref:Pimeloyl-ACP methyl ester carboxylesterase n=1 Tax=Williamsia marianensis TaxID=85044 RepID=A0A495KAJ8_WILMA|nr:alpha/beta fold hydrolase [Williamsia muralis]RKR97594.1 pimeloyl-ACP methyl ester carboxylesterase [Williamsia muralis]